MLYFPYYLLAEWVCFITSVLLINNFDKDWNAVRLYLGFVVLIESICYYMVWIAKCTSNQWLYNLSIPVEYGFSFWIFYRFVDLRKSKIIFLFAYLIFGATYLITLINSKGINVFFDKADTTGSVLIICLCMIYYYTLFQQVEYINILKDPTFWFVSGNFIFYTTSISVDAFFEKLVELRVNNSVSLRYIIMNILNIILYGCWIKSFICLNINKKSIAL